MRHISPLPSLPGWTGLELNRVHAWQLARPGPLVAFLARPAAEPPAPDRVAQAFGLDRIITLRQVHSDRVIPGSEAAAPDTVEADALHTDQPGLGIAVRVADCLPVYVRDPGNRAVGIAHAGRRGTAARIAEKLVRAMARCYRLEPAALEYALGPCICPDCYELGPELAEQLRSRGMGNAGLLRSSPNPGRFLFDIRAANRVQLNALGLTELPGLALCTKENPQTCFSFRRDGRTGHNLALIALSPEPR